MAITDAFTDANGTLLTAHATSSGGSWAVAEGVSWDIQTNKGSPTSSAAVSAMVLTDGSFGNDQYAQGVFKTGDSTDNYAFVAVRMTGNTYYFVRMFSVAEGGVAQVYKRLAGAASVFIAGWTHGIADATDCTVKLTILGTTLEVFINGVSLSTTTDGDIVSGKPGLGGSWDGVLTKKVIDDFEASNASAPSATRHRMSLVGAG